jgi:hypothetical protein
MNHKCHPHDGFLPASAAEYSARVRMPESFNSAKWNGVSDKGKKPPSTCIVCPWQTLAVPWLQNGTNRNKANLRVANLDQMALLMGSFGVLFRHDQAGKAHQDFRQSCVVHMVCTAW